MRTFSKFELNEIKRISTELRQRAIEITRLESELGAILTKHRVPNNKAVANKLWDEIGTLQKAVDFLEATY